jgi:hypothetical protein
LRHRFEERQRAVGRLDSFVKDRSISTAIKIFYERQGSNYKKNNRFHRHFEFRAVADDNFGSGVIIKTMQPI